MNLFAYGTLMDPEIMRRVSGGSFAAEPATLAGYVRKRVSGEVYPAIVKGDGGAVRGVVYLGLSRAAIDRIDCFEGDLYVRTLVSVTHKSGPLLGAFTYVLSGEYLSRLGDDDWSLDAFLTIGKSGFVRTRFGV